MEDLVFCAPHTLCSNPVDNQLPKTNSNDKQKVFLVGREENDEFLPFRGEISLRQKPFPKTEHLALMAGMILQSHRIFWLLGLYGAELRKKQSTFRKQAMSDWSRAQCCRNLFVAKISEHRLFKFSRNFKIINLAKILLIKSWKRRWNSPSFDVWDTQI